MVHLGNIVTAKLLPDGYMGNASVGTFLKLLADLAGLWMWGLCVWFFLVSVGAHWQVMRGRHAAQFDMTWYSFVFPNTAMVTATQAVGRTFGVAAIQILGTVLAVLLVLVWFFVFGMMIRAFWLRRLLWPDGIDGRGREMKSDKSAATAQASGMRRGSVRPA
jgi:tellurite resistance protein TehA-like permease